MARQEMYKKAPPQSQFEAWKRPIGDGRQCRRCPPLLDLARHRLSANAAKAFQQYGSCVLVRRKFDFVRTRRRWRRADGRRPRLRGQRSWGKLPTDGHRLVTRVGQTALERPARHPFGRSDRRWSDLGMRGEAQARRLYQKDGTSLTNDGRKLCAAREQAASGRPPKPRADEADQDLTINSSGDGDWAF